MGSHWWDSANQAQLEATQYPLREHAGVEEAVGFKVSWRVILLFYTFIYAVGEQTKLK